MKKIKLSNGKSSLIDDEDFEKISKFKWHLNNQGYASAWVNGEKISLHRFLLNLKRDDGLEIDHKNRKRLDNRKLNIRICSRSENALNRGVQSNNKTSGIKGVCYDKSLTKHKWRATLKGKHIGVFKNKTLAKLAYLKKLGEI